MEDCEIRIAFLKCEGAEREAESDVVERVRLLGV